MFLLDKKEVIDDIQVLTEEERQDSSLVKQRQDYKDSSVAVYYGSEKSELDNVCLTCKKYLNCKDRIDVQKQEELLASAINNPSMVKHLCNNKDFSEQDIEKIKNNVFIIINCVNKEERGEE